MDKNYFIYFNTLLYHIYYFKSFIILFKYFFILSFFFLILFGSQRPNVTHTHVHKKSGTSFARLQYLNMVISISWWVQYIQLYTKTFFLWGIAQCTRKNSSYWKFVRIVDALSLTVMNWRNMSQCYERIAVHK